MVYWVGVALCCPTGCVEGPEPSLEPILQSSTSVHIRGELAESKPATYLQMCRFGSYFSGDLAQTDVFYAEGTSMTFESAGRVNIAVFLRHLRERQ